jgi:hypothetical protein
MHQRLTGSFLNLQCASLRDEVGNVRQELVGNLGGSDTGQFFMVRRYDVVQRRYLNRKLGSELGFSSGFRGN